MDAEPSNHPQLATTPDAEGHPGLKPNFSRVSAGIFDDRRPGFWPIDEMLINRSQLGVYYYYYYYYY